MPSLPAASSFTASTVTEAQFKTAITDQREFLAGLLGTAGTQAAALTALGAALNGVASKNADYTAVAGDRGKLIDYTAAPFTLSLPTVATAGAGYVLGLRNSASGLLTVNRNAANIDGAAANLTLAADESCLIVCDGTGWKTVGRTGGKGRLLRITRYSTAGSGTWTKPSDVNAVRIRAVGGGGGGGGNIGSGFDGGGGGSGGYCEKWIDSPAGSYAYVVGAGGTSSHNTAYGEGGGGGNTTIAGMTAGGGTGALSTHYTAPLGGAGGTASGGDVNIRGERGHEAGVGSGSGRGGTPPFGRGGYAAAGTYTGLLGGGGAGNQGQVNTGGAGWIEIEEYA